MATVQKFLFDISFDEPDAAPAAVRPDDDVHFDEPGQSQAEADAEPPPPPPPTFSEEELALAREQSFEAGRVAGLSEAETGTERMIGTALSALASRLDGITRQQREANELKHRDAVRVAVAVARKLLPAMAATSAIDEVEAVVASCIDHLLDEPRLILRTHPDIVEPLRERVENLARNSGFEGKLVFNGDARLALGDCKVEWADGGTERDQTRLWAEIEEVIERALAPAEAKASADADMTQDATDYETEQQPALADFAAIG